MDEMILEAIIRANKLGAKGVQVIGYIEPQTASQPSSFLLITRISELISASDKEWYDD